jgi:hypothetical protein
LGSFDPPPSADGSTRPPSITTDEFTVTSPGSEFSRQEADHEYLRRAAASGDGAFFPFQDAEKLFDHLPDVEFSPKEQLPSLALWNKWFTFVVFFLLLVAEWVLRKRRGLV